MIENSTNLERLRHDTIDPVVQAMLIEPLNALSNGFNFVAEKSGSSLRAGKIETAAEPQYESPIDSAVAAVAGGLAASVPYTIAGQAIGGVARIATTRFNKFVRLPVALTGLLVSQRTANILGGAVYDGLKDTRKGETHLGNAVGGAASFAVFEYGNSRGAGLKGIGWLSHHMKVGAAGSLAHATTSDLASGKNPLARKDYLDVALSGAAMNSVLPLVQKGGGHLIDKVNLRLGRGIPIERDFARQGNPQLSELGKQAPLARVHIVQNESPRANHKEQAIFVSSHNNVRERAHETHHLISERQKTFEPLFRKSADALEAGDQWLAWQLFRQARLHEELGARKVESLADGERRSSLSFAKLRDYLPIWKEEFAKFKESGGTYRPELDYSLKHKVSFKSRTLATVESDLDACGVLMDSVVVNRWTPKPRELTLTEARKLLAMKDAAEDRRECVESDRYRDYYSDNPSREHDHSEWMEYNSHFPYDPKFTRAYNRLIKGKSDGARWIAKELKFKSPVVDASELTQKHLDDLGRQWNLFREIKPLLDDPTFKPFHISPYHLLGRKGINTPDDAIAFLDLWVQVARPNAQFRYRGNPNINTVALVAKYCSSLPLHAKKDLVSLPYGEFHRLNFERLGNVYRLIDCARAWKVEPELPKNVAEQVGRMPANQRFAAKVAWKEMRLATDREASRAERMAVFWESFKKWSSKEP
ncbi:MAG: hypothetical protein K2X29_08115, partial [Candidatus Obscuribacterales bacterium]|nr:hypothetical protein [Candidatus Obscuribacterales bacterium]